MGGIVLSVALYGGCNGFSSQENNIDYKRMITGCCEEQENTENCIRPNDTSVICTQQIVYYWDSQMNADQMGDSCNTHGKDWKCIHNSTL
jgi:hypothetical protein